jgi:type VI secretion system secreted protein Hcp
MSDVLILDLGTDIKGNCTIDGYADKIIVLSFSHSANMPLQADSAQAERTIGRPVISEMSFTKMTDLATTEIYQFCVKGTPIPTAKLHVGRLEGSSGAYMSHLEYTLTNVLISKISTSGGGGTPSDSFSLNFTAITCDYKQQQASAAAKGTASWGWDKATVKVAGK